MEQTPVLDDFVGHLKKGLRDKAREKITPLSLDRGQFVFFENDPAVSLYLLESGTLEANIVHGDGKVYIFHFLFPGDILGEGSLFGQESYPFSVVVRKDARIWRMAKDDVMEWMRADPGFAAFISEHLARKLDLAYTKARCIAGERVERRIACMLLKSFCNESYHEECPDRMDGPLTNRDISGLIGSTEETVSRVMSRLKREGVLETRDKQLVVLDREALMSYADSF